MCPLWSPSSYTYTRTAVDLLTKMLKFNPRERLPIDEVLEHPYFAPIRNESEESVAPHQLDFGFEECAFMEGETLKGFVDKQTRTARVLSAVM